MDTTLAALVAFAQRHDFNFVIQNGSRVNPSGVADAYSDYDVIFGCGEPGAWVGRRDWLGEFGQPLIVQENPCEGEGRRWPIVMTQFASGLRIDAQFCPLPGDFLLARDSLSLVVYDKGGTLPAVVPSDADYVVKRPTPEEYALQVNELWWCALYVGKALARGEATYARYLLDATVRPCLVTLAGWSAGARNGWAVNPGKQGRFLQRWLDAPTWNALVATYPGAQGLDPWRELEAVCRLASRFDDALRPALGLGDKQEDEAGLLRYLAQQETNARRTR